ncbi:MAG TPA: Si-specific NAD(P)(+) transhydrogenase [Balneolales bacterium]|nr:Si-specific NAD(P)(+) transhydrogenase [Balneolales bacterium]
MSRDYDVIILGSGPAGFSCAMQSSKFGKRVLLVEQNERYLGGAWINTGTVPSKILREAANTIFKYNRKFSSDDSGPSFEHYLMEDLLKFKNKVQLNENEVLKRSLEKNKVQTIRGTGLIIDEHSIEVKDHTGNKKTFTTDFILVSTGSKPASPKKFKIDHTKIFDSSSIIKINHIPRRLVILGSGINAIEYATIFAAMGTNVTLLNENDHYLSFLDNEIRHELNTILDTLGIYVHHKVEVRDVRFNPLRNYTEIRYNIEDDEELNVIETEQVLYLGGHVPNTQGIGLSDVSISTDENGFIPVDEHYKTKVDSIYAGGDVNGFPAFASVSFSQGRLAACNMFNIPVDQAPINMPFGIYSIPEIASIGLTEKEAQKENLDYAVGKTTFSELTRANINNFDVGMLKLVFETDSLKLLGVHIIGEHACDLIHVSQAVMNYGGNINYFINQVFNYPTYAEAYKNAAFNGINGLQKK